MAKHESVPLAKPAKAGIFYIGTNILTKAISLLLSPIYTRLLPPSEYGVFSLYVTWCGILTVLISLGISGGAVYRGLGKFSHRESDLISSALGILFCVFGIILFIALILGTALPKLTGLAWHVNFIMLGEALLNSGEAIFFSYKRYRYAYGEICVINLLYTVLSHGIAILLIYLTPLGASARIYSSFAVTAALVLPKLILVARSGKIFSKEIYEYLLKLSAPLLPNAIALTLIAQSDKIMIRHSLGASALGKYSLAYSVGFMITVITGALYSAVQPWIMRKLNGGKTELASSFIKKLIFLSSAGLLLFLLFVPEIFGIIATGEYMDAELSVYPLACAGILQFIANVLSASIIHREKTARLSLFSLSAFAANLLLNIMLLPRFGYTAAAFTTALAYGILVFLEYSYLKRKNEPGFSEGNALSPLFLLFFSFPIYLLRNVLISRLFLSLALMLFSLPTVIRTVKEYTHRRPGGAGAK